MKTLEKIIIPLFSSFLFFCQPEEKKEDPPYTSPVCLSCAEPSQSCNLKNKYCYGNEECLCVLTENYGWVGVCVKKEYLPLNPEKAFECYNLVQRNLDW